MFENKDTPVHVLLVEDHSELALSVCEFLELHHMVVDHAANVSLAKQLLLKQSYQVVILDINLPDGNGYQICEFLRQQLGLSMPVIMLTALDALEDKLTGFESGADDYLVKPFDMPELVARIHALVKRERGEIGNNIIKIADLSMSISCKEVMRDGQLLELSPLLFKLLHLLMREAPKPVSKQSMMQELWGEDAPDSDSLRSHLYMLRKTIDKPFEQKLMHTLQGQGVFISSDTE